jgi:murein DD-endopeptidase MepM/ murein hydrolase activator NlpD
MVLFLLSMTSNAQSQPEEGSKTPIDTLPYQDTHIVLFTDQSWAYLREENFDGILNKGLHDIVSKDTSLKYKLFWNTEMPFTYDNDLSKLRDTIWLCTVDTNHKRWCIPVKGTVLSSFKYRGSRFHHGLDIDLNIGDPVKAAFDGVVRYAQYNKGGFGNCVIIRHYNGLETYYAHFSKIKVRPYQRVSAGEVIGLGGCTGRCYGPHLHFEVRFYDTALDPAEIFDFENNTLKDENLLVSPSMFNYRAVSNKNILLDRYKNNPEMQKKIEEDYEDKIHNSPDKTDDHAHKAVVEHKYPNKNSKYHKVRSGDTLSAIARQYGTTVTKLCDLNGIRREKVLSVGQKIRVK